VNAALFETFLCPNPAFFIKKSGRAVHTIERIHQAAIPRCAPGHQGSCICPVDIFQKQSHQAGGCQSFDCINQIRQGGSRKSAARGARRSGTGCFQSGIPVMTDKVARGITDSGCNPPSAELRWKAREVGELPDATPRSRFQIIPLHLRDVTSVKCGS